MRISTLPKSEFTRTLSAQLWQLRFVQEIFLGGGGWLYFQTSAQGLVRIDVIGSAKYNCKENCLRTISLDWKADKPKSLAVLRSAAHMRSHWEICSPSCTRAEMPKAVCNAVCRA